MTDTTAVPGSGTPDAEPGAVVGAADTPSVDYRRYFDMAALLAGELPPAPVPRYGVRDDGHALFYDGQVNIVFGDPEGGKTWVCLAAAVELLRTGATGRVLVIDLDHNGPTATAARLLALGADSDAIADPERFLYIEPEDGADTVATVDDMRTWAPDLVVVDSLGELMPMFGSSSNSADEYTTVNRRVLKPLAMVGACVLVIDHLSKGSDSRKFGPTGTAAKRRAVGGVSVRVQVKDQFTPGKGGSAYLTVNKDRHGGLREHCEVGDREPLAGVFELKQFEDGVLEGVIRAPKDNESAPPDFGIDAVNPEDVAALDALDPPPKSVRDVKERMKWRSDRSGNALRAWREGNGE